MNNGKVLFIIHDNLQAFNSFPLGPAYIAALLMREGVHVDVYCQDLYHQSNDELADYLSDNEYDLIGIGFLSARFTETVFDLCRIVKKHKKNALMVLGGQGPSPIPEYILQTTQAEIAVLGEGEKTVVDIIKTKLNGKMDYSSIHGIAWRIDDTTHVNPRRNPIIDLDTLPMPAWEIFPMDDYTKSMKYQAQPDDITKSLNVCTTRGCINACSFCYRMEKGIRVRSIDNVLEELRTLKENYGVSYFSFSDEMFVLNKKRLLEFKDKLDMAGLNIIYSCAARVDLLHDKGIVQCLKDTGCVFIHFGIESMDNRVLKLMNKNATAEQNTRAVETVLETGGIGAGLNVLWGNVGDNEKSLRKGVEFIKKYNTYDYIRTIRPPTPYPGSALYYLAMERGKLEGPAGFFRKFKNSDLYMVNFTDIPISHFYGLLYEANRELLVDHYTHSTKDKDECEALIDQFKELYEGTNPKFRGTRKFTRT